MFGRHPILVGDRDELIKNERLYHLQELQRLHKDWPVIAIKDADHITCILKKQFPEEIAAWIKKNSKYLQQPLPARPAGEAVGQLSQPSEPCPTPAGSSGR
jgi:hypothetical protein